MRSILLAAVLLALALPCHADGESSPASAGDTARDPSTAPEFKASRNKLTPTEQKAFLGKRGPGAMLGSLGNFASLLYAAEDILIGSSNREVVGRQLHSCYPSKVVYQPTRAEFFDTIARQTGTSYKYMAENDSWIFDEPAMPLPFTIDMASGWKAEDRGQYVAYIPPVAPVGMDIYMMGKYSDITPEQKSKIEEYLALSFEQALPKNTKVSDMVKTTVDGVDALYFECAGKAKNMNWRQWAFIKNGQGYVIVSAFQNENKSKIVADVDGMLKTFHVK